jgi:hypothetical protein
MEGDRIAQQPRLDIVKMQDLVKKHPEAFLPESALYDVGEREAVMPVAQQIEDHAGEGDDPPFSYLSKIVIPEFHRKKGVRQSFYELTVRFFCHFENFVSVYRSSALSSFEHVRGMFYDQAVLLYLFQNIGIQEMLKKRKKYL